MNRFPWKRLGRRGAWVVVGCAAACQAPASHETRSLCIVGGSEKDTTLSLSPVQREAIAPLSIVRENGNLGSCTGVFVGRGLLLTAGHCVRNAREVHVVGTCGESLEIVGWSVHSSLDVAFAKVDGLDVVGWIPLASFAPSPETDVEIAGYGTDAEGNAGRLNFAVQTVVAVTSEHVVLSSDGRAGACVGDSGGPALARDDSGDLKVLGFLSAGDASCLGEDRYVRADILASWLPQES